MVIPKNSDSPYGDFSFWGGSDKVAISLARRSPKRRCVTPIQSPPNSPVIRFENKNTAVYSHDHDPNQILSELERILKPRRPIKMEVISPSLNATLFVRQFYRHGAGWTAVGSACEKAALMSVHGTGDAAGLADGFFIQ